MASIKEIAKLAGVSTATVSRVLNESPFVVDETRERVLQCIEETGYHMNQQARNLRMNRTGNIIALVASIRNPIFIDIINGMSQKARGLGLNILISSIENDMENVKPYIDMLRTGQADGIIFVSKSFDREILSKIQGKYPFILCNEYFPDINAPYVSIDNQQAAIKATEYLIRKGCKNIGYISGHTSSHSTDLRADGYRKALESAGIAYNGKNIIFGTNSKPSEYKKIADFIAENNFDGLLVNSDVKAALAIKYLLEEKKMDYKRINLVSFDGTYMSDLIVPAFTSIEQPMYRIGEIAVQNLALQIEGKEFEEKTFVPFEFKIRET